MKHIKLSALIFVIILVVIALYYLNSQSLGHATPSPAELQLIQAGDRCAEIADKSIADKTAIVEFQRLEFASRRDNVLLRCMRDNGYTQNPAWLKYAAPIAQSNATQQNISLDEAMTTLGRKEMQTFKKNGLSPLYWVELPTSSSR